MNLLLTVLDTDLEASVETHWAYRGDIARKAGGNL